MNWGKWIFLSFVLFAVFIGTLVSICVRQDISLVSKTYYQDELNYQSELERKQNTESLSQKPEIKFVDDDAVQVRFAGFNQPESGELTLYSPSDIRADRTFSFSATQGPQQTFALGEMKKGLYKAKMTWTASGKSFYFEQTIYH